MNARQVCIAGAKFLQKAICLIPVYVVLALIAVDYKTFVWDYGIKQEHDYPFLVFILEVLFNIVAVLLVVSYLRCVFTSSAVADNPPPPGYFERLGRPVRYGNVFVSGFVSLAFAGLAVG